MWQQIQADTIAMITVNYLSIVMGYDMLSQFQLENLSRSADAIQCVVACRRMVMVFYRSHFHWRWWGFSCGCVGFVADEQHKNRYKGIKITAKSVKMEQNGSFFQLFLAFRANSTGGLRLNYCHCGMRRVGSQLALTTQRKKKLAI